MKDHLEIREMPKVKAKKPIIILTNEMQLGSDFDTAGFPVEDIEMLSTMEIDELESMDFYYWLETMDGAT